MKKHILTSLFYLLAAPALAGKSDSAYLKGNEGEKLVSAEDVSCADTAESKHSLVVTFSLNPEARERAAKFAKENTGISASIMACGTPLSVKLNEEFSGPGAISVNVPKPLRDCVKRLVKNKKACKGVGAGSPDETPRS